MAIAFLLPPPLPFAALLLLLSACWSAASTTYEYNPVDVSCSLTFRAWEGGNPTCPASPFWMLWPPIYRQPLPLVTNRMVVCPANCTTATPSNTSSSAALFGSFPYSPTSSICRAAIHAGIISDATGGGVYVSRFYRHDWSGGANQTIYPHGSWRGSQSNGVQSGDVNSSSHLVPASSRDWSYTVRGRGDFVVQRRQAPFPPRAGHVHAAFVHVTRFLNNTVTYFHVQVVVGGHNDTAYLNDVWVATARLDEAGEDVTWYRLRDAPFSPRSDVVATYDYSFDGWERLYLLGGQIGHACGLRELGVCSSEVWVMQLAVNATTGVPSAGWTGSSLPAGMSTRCGAALIAAPVEAFDALLVVGGQLSYNDSSCSTPPVSVSEQWRVDLTSVARPRVNRGPDAPFSPRRWAGGTTAYFSWGEDFGPTGFPNAPYASLIGGYRLVNVSSAGNGILQLDSMEFSADLWPCNQGGCWSLYYNGSFNGAMVPPLSVPLPTAFSPVTADSVAVGSVSFGGVMPRAAIEQWRHTLPLVDRDMEDVEWREVAANVTLMSFEQAGYLVGGMFGNNWPTPADSLATRMQLPLTAVMGDDELNDPTGDYALGSEWTLSYDGIERWAAASQEEPMFLSGTTLHERPRAFADSPIASSWWTPMAASSANTRRPLFNFDLRRRDHRTTSILHWLAAGCVWGSGLLTASTWTSGGRSGTHYYNDVMLSLPMRCWLPDDPSYRAALGPTQWQPPLTRATDHWWQWVDGTAETGTYVVVFCPTGYHLEPPSIDFYVTLYCQADGMWMDPAANTVRRCVRNVLNCTLPLVDVGLEYCQPVLPIVSDVFVSYSYNGSNRMLTSADGGMALSGLPPMYEGTVLVRIGGNLFVEPVRVLIHGYECSGLTLEAPQSLCYNASITSDHTRSHYVCDRVSPWVSCHAPLLYGVDMDVIVLSGRGGEVAETSGYANNDVITITSAAPAISRLESADCRSEQPLSLVDCPVDRHTALTVCAASDSVAAGAVLEVMLGALIVGNCSFNQIGRDEFCAVCVVMPQYGTLLPLALHQPMFGLRSTTAAFLSFASCPAGQWLDSRAMLHNATSLCAACPAGSSTMNSTGQMQCTLCPAGTYSHAGDADCTACSPGWFSSSPNSSSCSLCPLNSYANDTRQTGCQLCSLNDYIVYASNHSHGRPIDGECMPCPIGSTCTISGRIMSPGGQYLLIDQQAATVSSIRCSSSACMSAAAQCPTADDSGSGESQLGDQRQQQQPPQPQPQLIITSQLRVVNCCGAGRWPAYVNVSSFMPSNTSGSPLTLPDDLLDTDGVNVLCAHCLPGYSAINGR